MNKELEKLNEIKVILNTLIGLLEDIFVANNEPIKETIKKAKHATKQIPKIETALKDYEYLTKVFEKLTEPKLPTLSKKEWEQLKKNSGYIIEYKGIYVDEKTYKKLKALTEILALHDKWLGNEMSDFEFFTQLNEILYRYKLSKR